MVLTLQAGLAALLLLPSQIFLHTIHARLWILFAAYSIFFSMGTVRRILRFGRLARSNEDRQRSTLQRSLVLAAFICAVPALHYLAVFQFASCPQVPGLLSWVSGSLLLSGITVNTWASEHL